MLHISSVFHIHCKKYMHWFNKNILFVMQMIFIASVFTMLAMSSVFCNVSILLEQLSR